MKYSQKYQGFDFLYHADTVLNHKKYPSDRDEDNEFSTVDVMYIMCQKTEVEISIFKKVAKKYE